MTHRNGSDDDAGSVGLGYIDHHADKLIARHVRRRGSVPPGSTHDDIEQEIHLELLEEFGPGYLETIGRLILRTSEDQGRRAVGTTLDCLISRAIDRLYWTESKRRQRGMPKVSFIADLEAGDPRPQEFNVVDLAMDIESALAGLSKVHRDVWRLRREGQTTREIGARIGLSHQKVTHMLDELVTALADLLAG